MRGMKIIAIIGLAVVVAGLGMITANAQQSCAPTGPFRDWILRSVANADQVVIAIDNSGSVREANRLPTEKQCAIATVQVLSGKQFAILSFNDSVTVVQPLTNNTSTLISAINSIGDTDRATDIAAAINAACSITTAAPGPGAMVLETDGIPTRGSPDPLTAARNAANNFKANCSTLAVIGVDIDNAEAARFLNSIASPGAYMCTGKCTGTPTLTEWGLIALAVLLAGSLAWMIRRRVIARPAGA